MPQLTTFCRNYMIGIYREVVNKCIYRFLFLFFFSCLALNMAGQSSADTIAQAQTNDSATHDLRFLLRQAGQEDAKKNIEKFNTERIALKQSDLIRLIRLETLKAKEYLKRGLDTLLIKNELLKMQAQFSIARDGIFINQGTAQTYRNLTSSTHILKELLVQVQRRKTDVDRYENDLVKFRYRIDSLSSDSAIYIFPSDSSALRLYLGKLTLAAKEIGPVDTMLKQTIIDVEGLQTNVDLFVNLLNSNLDEINGYQQNVFDKTFDREFSDIWEEVGFNRPINEIIAFSIAKGKLTFLFYIQYHLGKIFIILILVAAATLFLSSLKKLLAAKEMLHTDFHGQMVLRYPFLSAVVLVLNLFQFIFPEPPFTFNFFFWIISAIALTFVVHGTIAKRWLSVWIVLFTLFLLACADNLLLQASRFERWFILGLSITGLLSCSLFLFRSRRSEIRQPVIFYFIVFGVLLEAASIIANVYGRFNFAKTLMTSGYINVVIAIMFVWTIRMINEGLRLASQVYSSQDKKLFYINFEKVGEKVPGSFYVLMVIGWFILFGRNFYSFRRITDPLRDFLFVERTVGNYSFTLSNVLVFFLIMSIAALISKIVSFFAADKHTIHTGTSNEKRAGVGSWILLVRITIISMGLFFAIAATGIEVDRITIIFGALSVGVGLGLQSLVNNLVSGLIIAFEKPVNVGDIVEVGGQIGTMKSIGFRSSVISTPEGADLIVPNGDLLNNRLLNWTMGKYMRRSDVTVSVAYGTDLDKAKQLLNQLMIDDERIFKNPLPQVLIQQLGNNAINVTIYFWVRHRELATVKSDLLGLIEKQFKKEGIEIPLLQEEIRIHPMPPQKT